MVKNQILKKVLLPKYTTDQKKRAHLTQAQAGFIQFVTHTNKH